IDIHASRPAPPRFMAQPSSGLAKPTLIYRVGGVPHLFLDGRRHNVFRRLFGKPFGLSLFGDSEGDLERDFPDINKWREKIAMRVAPCGGQLRECARRSEKHSIGNMVSGTEDRAEPSAGINIVSVVLIDAIFLAVALDRREGASGRDNGAAFRPGT